jgi:hypothetical protein
MPFRKSMSSSKEVGKLFYWLSCDASSGSAQASRSCNALRWSDRVMLHHFESPDHVARRIYFICQFLILDWNMWDVKLVTEDSKNIGRILSVWGAKLRCWLYLQIKHGVVCCSPRTSLWNLATYTQSICSSAKSWNGFSREVSSRKEQSNQPLGLFCDNQGPHFTFNRSAGATFYLIWNIETSISPRPFNESVIILLAYSVFLSVLFLNSRIRTEDYPAPCIHVPDVESGVDEHFPFQK